MPVQVFAAKKDIVELSEDFPGKLIAVDKVDIRPQVSGKVEQILFTEGAQVNKGDKLMVINSSFYKTQLSQAQSAYSSAYNEYVRAEKLIKIGGISRKEFEDKLANKNSAYAALTNARLNASYSDVVAPISGRVGRAEVTVGNLVDQAAGQILTTIVSDGKLYAEFDLDEATYLKFAQDNPNLHIRKVPVGVILSGETEPSYSGFITSFDNQINEETGTVRARAEIENKDGKLISGLFAKIRLTNPSKKEVVLIPETSVGTDQDKKFVYVVNAENKVDYKPIVTGRTVSGMKIIESGLNEGERVITSSTIMIRPGVEVNPK